jgi:hypothetical protein
MCLLRRILAAVIALQLNAFTLKQLHLPLFKAFKLLQVECHLVIGRCCVIDDLLKATAYVVELSCRSLGICGTGCLAFLIAVIDGFGSHFAPVNFFRPRLLLIHPASLLLLLLVEKCRVKRKSMVFGAIKILVRLLIPDTLLSVCR